ncbi:MAG: hypothetical protein AUK44_06945 [Porphyromonadaceae bacterium CG2_30_38_12]|nr:MAG: hypothetical protein AUK44_06945 [Porphyromonadaceae bacterium CG2_30_38_12]
MKQLNFFERNVLQLRFQLAHFFVFCFILTSILYTYADNPYQTKKINGVEYILYTAQAGEGMYGISKRFDVTLDELNSLNPEAASGLKVGQILLIPRKKLPKNITNTSTAQVVQTNNQKTIMMEHVVEKKQTLFAISRKYNVSQDELKKANPELEKGLKTGMVLHIPQSVNTNKATSNGKNDTENSLVTQADKQEISDKKPIVSIPVLSSTPTYLTRLTNKVKPNQQAIKVAILLPLTMENQKNDAVNERFQEFYAGFLIAANAAKSKGVSLEIYSYDTEKSEEKMAEVLQQTNLKQVDLIVGPAYSNQISSVSEFALQHKIPTIIPFSSKVPELNSNPYLLQFNPSSDAELDYFFNLLSSKQKSYNLIFMDLSESSYSDYGYQFSSNLKEMLLKNAIDFHVLPSVTEQNIATTTYFEKDKINVVIFNTEKFSGIFPYIAYLNNKSSEFEIVLYEQYSWKNQNTTRKFKSLSVAPFKANLNDSEYLNYTQLFQKYFDWKVSTTNPRYDVLGYDLGNYFIAMLYQYGGQFDWGKNKLPLASGVQSYLKFERYNALGGFVNKQLYEHDR